MKQLWKEPLLHFLLIGAGLFGMAAWASRNEPEEDAAGNTIIITDSLVAQLIRNEQQHRGMAFVPDRDKLIRDYLTTEMLYREALKTGLDQNNDSLKALLAGQMRVAYEPTEHTEPTDEQLKALLQDPSWYANDSGLPDTSAILFDMMRRPLQRRYATLEKENAFRERMKTLEKNYQIIRRDAAATDDSHNPAR